jgi:hypothetical protein
MANTSVMTVRIDRALLDVLKRAAQAEGRSMSGQVVHVLKKELHPTPKPAASPGRSVAGMFAHVDVAEHVEEYGLGPWIGAVLDRRARRHARRTRP